MLKYLKRPIHELSTRKAQLHTLVLDYIGVLRVLQVYLQAF